MRRNLVVVCLLAIGMFGLASGGANAQSAAQEYERAGVNGALKRGPIKERPVAPPRTVEPWAGGMWAASAREYFARGEFQKAKQVLLARRKKWGDWADYTMINSALKDIYLAEKGAIRADCGAVALSHLLAMNGQAVSERELDETIRQGRESASLLDLAAVSRRRGLLGEGITLGLDLAGELKGPWIAYLDAGHFVLVTSATPDHLVVVGSDGVTRDYTAEAFSENWSGNALVFDRRFVARHPELKLDRTLMAQLVGGCDVPADGCGEPVAEGGGNDNGTDNDQAQQDQGEPACPKWRLNLSRLNLILEDTDIAYRTIGPSAAITRTYNADCTYLDLFGRKWMWSYGTKLSEGTGGGVVAVYPSGRMVGFNWTGTSYYATDGSHDVLTLNGDSSFSLYRRDEYLTYNYQPIATGGRLTAITDRNGNTLQVEWLPDKVEITDAVGRKTTCSIQGGRIVQVTDPVGRTASFAYSGDDLVSSTDPEGYTSTYTYDSEGYVTSTTVPGRGTTQFTYMSDSRGKWLYQITNPDSTYRQYFLNPSVMCQDEKGKLSYYTNEKFDNKVWRNLSYQDNLGKVHSYTYGDSTNPALPTQVQDPRGAITQFAYDSMGNLITYTDPLNKATSYTYDSADNLLTTTDPLTRTATFEYDSPASGNLTLVTNALGCSTQFAYDARGLLTSVTDARGNTTAYSYDAYGNLESITDSAGNSTSYQHDLIGNLIAATDANGNATSYEYDSLNRVISITRPGGAHVRLTYGIAELLSVTDENGRVTYYEYDHYGKLKKTIDPLGGAVSLAYDANGNMTSLSDQLGHATTYTYDDVNRVTNVRYPDSTTEAYTYDGAGLLLSKRDGIGAVTSYSYDLAGKLLNASAPGVSIRYAYDAVGNPTSVRDGLGQTKLVYDELDRAVQVTNPYRQRIIYGYDEVGNRAWMQTPYGLTTYTYDQINLQVAVSAPWNTTYFAFDANGNRTGMYDTVRRAIYTYDNRDRITSVRNVKAATGEIITSHQYTYDPAGNPKTVIENDGARSYYGYDMLDRLVSETRAGGPAPYNYRYTYDPAGNRLTKTNVAAGQTTNYTYDVANKMLTAGSASFTYDGNGNLVTKSDTSGTTKYYWDARNKLVRADVPAIGTVQYGYDALGQRLRRTGPGGTATYLYDTMAAIPAVLAATSGGATTRYALTVGGSPIGEAQGTTSRAYVYNGTGSMATSVDGAGVIGSRGCYDAWGNGVGTGALSPRGYEAGFGYWTDSDTGLMLLGARWYDPAPGRFISRDPIRYRGGLNLYAYCGSKPTKTADPSGLCPGNGGVFPGGYDPTLPGYPYADGPLWSDAPLSLEDWKREVLEDYNEHLRQEQLESLGRQRDALLGALLDYGIGKLLKPGFKEGFKLGMNPSLQQVVDTICGLVAGPLYGLREFINESSGWNDTMRQLEQLPDVRR